MTVAPRFLASSRTTAISVGIPVAGVAVGVPTTLASATASSYFSWFPDFVVGWLFFAAAGWAYRSSRVTTAYGVLIGCLWFAGSVLPFASLWHRGAIAQLVLVWALVRPRRAGVIVAVVSAYALNLVPTIAGRPDVSIAFAAVLIAVGAVRSVTRRGGSVPLIVSISFGLGVSGAHAIQAGAPGPSGVYSGLLVYEAGVAGIALTLAMFAGRPTSLDPTDVLLDLRRRRPTRAGGGAILKRALGDVDDPALLEALATADRLTTTGAELEREANSRLRALIESRDRLAAAETQERARILRLLGEELDPLYEDVRAALAALPPSAGAERMRHRVAESAAEIDSLRAGLLAPTGDAPLASEIVELGSRSPIPVKVRGLPRSLPAALAEAVRYMCSEAILNAVKHSGASSIEIRGRRRVRRWVIDITDDGRGRGAARSGTGLRGISERARQVGARIQVTSPPGGGTRVSIELPGFSRRVARNRRSADDRRRGARTRQQDAP